MAYSEEMVGVITAIQSASLDQDKWPLAFKKLADFSHSPAYNFCVVDGERQVGVHADFTGVPDVAMKDYCAGRLRNDPFLNCADRMPIGATVHDYLHTSESEIDTHPFYAWWQSVTGLRYGMGTRLSECGGTKVYFSTHRAAKDGPMQGDEVDRFCIVMPHLLNGIEVSKRLTSFGAAQGSLTGIIDTLPRGLALVRKDGSVAYANEYLRRVIASNDGLFIEDAILKAGRQVDQQGLDKAIKLAVSSHKGLMPQRRGYVPVARASGKRHFTVIAIPLPPHVTFNLQPIAAMLFVVDPEERILCDALTLMEALGLTEREAEIAVRIAHGDEIAQIAEETGISVMTARKHLQHIYKKADVGRQGELVSLLCSFALSAPAEVRPLSGSFY